MVKFFSKTDKTMKCEFLGILEVERGTAEALTHSIKEYISGIGMSIDQLVGIGSDGANAFIGKHNSVFSRLKAEIPELQLVRCVCHTLHNAASAAATEMTADLEFLVRETRNWFFRSSVKSQDYAALYAAINNGNMPNKLVQLSTTRWLA
ncbi:SCAN domain-containing protein 3 [Frankliniella fusca]|uniref:SCAN domain-containing protein 3 n=1 Tax=Frankliniella fusca TaxID=407009 RepID=A0AAE1GVB7_9NEOP|nr:SCAN domain-containing protein 3 [Frankliniella fusca]